MPEKKYSTGKLGRLKKHADECKEAIRLQNAELAPEYIRSIDPNYSDEVWQQFPSPEHATDAFLLWLDGEQDAQPLSPPTQEEKLSQILQVIKPQNTPQPEPAPTPVRVRNTIPLSKLKEYLDETLQWAHSQEGQKELAELSLADQATYILGRVEILAEDAAS